MERFRAATLDDKGNPLRRAEDIPSADGTPYRPPRSLSTNRSPIVDPPKKKGGSDDNEHHRRASPRGGFGHVMSYYGNFA